MASRSAQSPLRPASPWSARAEAVRRWFFPEAVELPEGLDRLLGIVYPRLDRKRASFHRGLPHVLKLIPNQAITLPALAPRSGHVYIHPDCWRPGSVQGLGLFVHESYHLLQLQESGWGLGLARPFIVLYLACAAANRFRYAGHPMESDAYRIAGRRASVFEAAVDPALVPAAHLAGEPGCECPDLGPLASCCAPAVTEASGLAFWRKLALSTPGFRPLAGWAGRLAAPRGGRPEARPGGIGVQAPLGRVEVKPPHGRMGIRTRLARAGALAIAAPALLLAGLLVGLWLLLWSLATALLAAAELLVLGVGTAAAGALSVIAGIAGVARTAGRDGGGGGPEHRDPAARL